MDKFYDSNRALIRRILYAASAAAIDDMNLEWFIKI